MLMSAALLIALLVSSALTIGVTRLPPRRRHGRRR
jgi:hypothetical protein